MGGVTHTPGPWRVNDERGGRYGRLTIRGPEGEWVASGSEYLPDGTTLANAWLVAAAPDLLMALELVLRGEHHDCAEDECADNPTPCPYGLGRAAVRLAKGGKP